MSRFWQTSWPGWLAAIAGHGALIGGLLLIEPAPRPLAPQRPPVQVRLVARQPVPAPPALNLEPRSLESSSPPARQPRPQPPRPLTRRPPARPAATPAAVTPTAPTPAQQPRFSVSMSATVPGGGVAVPAEPGPGNTRPAAVPDWAREPAPASPGRGSGTGTGGGGAGPGTLEVGDAGSPPRLREQPDPEALRAAYPAQARAEGQEADVVLKILVDASGRVSAVKLLRAAGNGFDEVARRLVRSFRFDPGKDRSGRPVSVWIPWTYKFRLNG